MILCLQYHGTRPTAYKLRSKSNVAYGTTAAATAKPVGTISYQTVYTVILNILTAMRNDVTVQLVTIVLVLATYSITSAFICLIGPPVCIINMWY